MTDGPQSLAGLGPALAATEPLASVFGADGWKLYLVGGVVRDALLGVTRDGSDLDCTTDAPPDAVKKLVAPIASAVWSQGERFGTIGCIVRDVTFEITTHRAERYDPASRKPVVTFGDNIADDLARRDFTVNAMAVNVNDGLLIDPHDGHADLKASRLRTPLDPEAAFNEDPLRMIRAARFTAGYHLDPDPAVISAIRQMGDRLQIVSVERIRDEFEKLLLLDDPTSGLRLLHETELLERFLPEVSGSEVEIAGRVVKSVVPRAPQRWAAVFATKPDSARGRLRELKSSTDLVDSVDGFLGTLELLRAVTPDSPSIRRAVHTSRVPIDDAAAFSHSVLEAQEESTSPLDTFIEALSELRDTEDVDGLTVALDGDEVMNLLSLAPGPDVGRALSFLEELLFECGAITADEASSALREWWEDVS